MAELKLMYIPMTSIQRVVKSKRISYMIRFFTSVSELRELGVVSTGVTD